MIKIEYVETLGFDHAIRGMRNPMNSWDKSRSHYENGDYVIDKEDLRLMLHLNRAGSEHRKYLRQIFVSMDVTAPLYWWKEYDTYKVGTVANSCSTMHKIHTVPITIDDFSHEHLNKDAYFTLKDVIKALNFYRDRYIVTGDKEDWWQMIQLLPSSYNQRRTVTFNYENAVNIIHQRTGHKLDEWRIFVEELKGLPWMMEILGEARWYESI